MSVCLSVIFPSWERDKWLPLKIIKYCLDKSQQSHDMHVTSLISRDVISLTYSVKETEYS